MTREDIAKLSEVARIPLGSTGLFALVNKEDEGRVLELGNWYPIYHFGQVYAGHSHWNPTAKKQVQVKLHRIIMNAPKRATVMHRNGLGLDCTRDNLRFGNHHENGASHRRKQGRTSRFRGVSRNIGRGKKWQVSLTSKGEAFYVGKFDSEIDAAIAYNDAAIKHFGEHASINQI